MEEYLMKMTMCGEGNIESFRSHRTHSRLKQLPLPNFYFSAAPNSGPIALLYRKYDYKQIKLPDLLDSSILLFDCRGELLRTVPFELKERIVLFQFTRDQHLLILYATGTYSLLDTATATLHTANYFFSSDGEELKSRDRCVGARLVADKVVMLREKTLGLVDELEGKWRPLPTIKIHPDFPVFEVARSGRDDLEIIYLSSSFQIELSTVRKNERPLSSEVLLSHPGLPALGPFLVSASHRAGQLVLVFTEFLLWVDCKAPSSNATKAQLESNLSSPQGRESIRRVFGEGVVLFEGFKVQKEDPLCKTSSSYKYRNFYTLGWLGKVCYFSDRRRLFFSSHGNATIPQVTVTDSSFLLAEGEDILRLIDDYTYVFRAISDPIYLALTGHPEAVAHALSRSNEKELATYLDFCRLLVIFENAAEKKPNQLGRVEELRGRAGEVVGGLLRGAEKALDAGMQLKILKMAQWTQAMFGLRGDSKQLMGRLRVVNGLKYEHLSRWLTLSEFESLRNDRFLTMLLRSNMHFVADLIFDDSISKKKVFLHWAKCKIEKETPLAAIQQIQLRYGDMRRDLHSKFVFTELALYALRRPTPLHDLALRLAENEPHPARKCIVFLLAFKSKHSLDLVDKLLDFAEQSFCTGAIYLTLQTLLAMTDVPTALWLELLPKRPFLECFYLRMLQNGGNQEQLQHYLETNKGYTDLAYLSLAREVRKQSLPAACQLLQTSYAKILPALTNQLPRCQSRPGMTRLRELKCKVSPIAEEETLSFSEEGELELLGELVVSKDQNWQLGLSVWRRMRSERVYEVLKVKGRLRQAMEVAFERKDLERLSQLVNDLPEGAEESGALGRQMLEELGHTS